MNTASSEPFPIAEPRELFKTAHLKCFIECGGYDMLQSPAKMTAFSSEDDCFVTIFPGKRRIYRFDRFGALCDKFTSDAVPLCITWSKDLCEYFIGYNDYHIGRYDTCLKAVGRLPVPDKFEPRQLVCCGGHIYVSDLGERILCLGVQGHVQHQITLPGKVCHLAYVEERRCLVASIPNSLIGLDPDLRWLWSLDHFASESRVAAFASGDLWVALSSGQLWRLDRDNRKLVDVSIPPHVRTLAALERAVVIGTIQGRILLYDALGRKVGDDDLQTAIYHACATVGGLLVLSTAKGLTVVKPSPELTPRTSERLVDEKALDRLLEWERLAEAGVALHRTLEGHLQQLDLVCWDQVCALQRQFEQLRMFRPVLYKKIENALRLIDPRKAARICTKTTPVIIDGSNVSRYHWNNEHIGKKLARLGAILRVREKLANQTNPVFYPIIIIVDATERHYTDDLPTLNRMINEGEILEAPSAREADALILNLIRTNGWQHHCRIVSNDRRLFDDHADILFDKDSNWYEQVRMAFTINPKTQEVYFPERSP